MLECKTNFPSDLFDFLSARDVPRPELSSRILSSLDRTSCALVAPAGSGKTAIVNQVQAEAEGRGWQVVRPPAWRSLLDSSALEAAIECGRGSTGSRRTIVVVDELGNQNLALDGLAQVVEMADPAVRFLIAVRRGGPLPIKKWISDGRIEALNAKDLSFTRACLSHPETSFLSAREVNWLIDEMEGWPIAYRVLFDLRKRNPRRSAEATIRQALVWLSEYVEEQVFAELDEDTARFLMETAVLREFNLGALRQVCGYWDFGLLLGKLTRQNLFIENLDSQSGVFAYAKGFGAIASSRLARHDFDRKLELHEKAAIYHLAHDQALLAMRHARATHNHQFIDKVEEAAGGWKLGLKVGPRLFGASNQAKEASQFPNVNLGRAYMLAHDGRLTEARILLERFKNIGMPGPATDTVGQRSIQSDLHFAVMDSVFRLYEDRPLRVFEKTLLASLQREYDAADPVLSASICSVNALIAINEGRYRDAVHSCEIGLLRTIDEELPYIEYYLRIKYGSALVALGFAEKAAEQLDLALSVSGAYCGKASVEHMAAMVLRGGLHYEQNELEEAQNLFNACFQPFLPTNGWYDFYKEGFSAAATLTRLTKDTVDTTKVIEHCRSIARIKGIWRLSIHADVLEIRDHLRTGNVEQAMVSLQSPRISKILKVPSHRQAPWLQPLVIAARLEKCRAMVFLGRYRDAGEELKAFALNRTENEDVRAQLFFDILSMEVNFQKQQYQAAVDNMEVVVASANRYGLVRRLMNHAHTVEKISIWCGRNNWPLSPAVQAMIKSMLLNRAAAGSAGQRAWATGAHKPILRLSPREAMILELLADGFSNKEIAIRLRVAEGTVKFYRKKIYQKLGANTRASAIRQARESLLL